jgi:predicted Rossmann fold nucleotide-binding protein DprA/Smf involved in DNA uptake
MVSAMRAGARSEDALAALLLTTRLADAAPAPLSPTRFWSLVAAVPAPSELLASAAGDIARRTGLPDDEARRVEGLLAAGTPLAFALERLERQGVVAVTSFDEGYPASLRDRLGDQAPPVLFTVGEVKLLSSEGIGVVGSRAVTGEGAEIARRVAARTAEGGLCTISGGARGVDREAMVGAHGAGGRVLAYLADGLLRRIREPDTRRAVAEGRICLATAFEPSTGFSAANAIGRNKLIFASARVTLVVACEPGHGGTWEGATEALRHGYGPVAVWVGPGAGGGNVRLVEHGATPVDDVSAVFRVSLGGPAAPAVSAASEQLRLSF